MLTRRLLLLVAGMLLCGAGASWIMADREVLSAGTPIRLNPGVTYSVETAYNRATLDLPFDPETRYVLIIGSLGAPDRSYRVTLTARPIDHVTAPAVQRLSAPDVPMNKRAEALIPSVFSLSRADRQDKPDGLQQADRRFENRVFFLHASDGPLDDANEYTRLRARLIAEGQSVRVYLDRRQPARELAIGLAEEIVRTLDTQIIPLFRRKLGRFRDVDGDGKFAVLLTPLLGRLQGGRTSVEGFVRGDDFRSDVRLPFSNHCDMMSLNAHLKPGPHLKTILAHEFAHAVCFSERLPTERGRSARLDEEDWLNEAIAHLAENLVGGDWSNLDDRLRDYLNAPERHPLVVPDYARAGLWRNTGCRGATYLFLRWCVDQYGDDLLPRLIHGHGYGIHNVVEATAGKTSRTSFPGLFRRWSIALYTSGLQPTAGRGDYQSIRLRGPLGRHRLRGPHIRCWNVDTGEQTVRLKGTAVMYFELRTSEHFGPRRIRVSGEFGSGLQVSIVARRATVRSTLQSR